MCSGVRISVVLAVLGMTLAPVHAQDYANVRHFLENSFEFRTANPVVQQIAKSNSVPRFNWAIIDSGQQPEHMGRPVWLFASVIRALQAEPGRLGFVVGHGIARNDIPTKIENKNLVCTDKPAQTMAALRDPRDYVVKSRAECESLADPVAVQYMARAGYKPLDAVAFIASVLSGRQNEYGHQLLLQSPWIRDYADTFGIDTQRLVKLRQFVNEFCRENTASC